MANDCSRLMKDALDNYLGIDMRYKLDDTLASLGKQKFSAKQLEGYLLKKGVSPREIKQSGIFEGMDADNRAISADDWLGMSGNQRLSTSTLKGGKHGSAQFADISLGRKGSDNETYKEVLTGVASPRDNIPREPHFSNQLPAIPNNKEVLAKEAVDKYIAKEKDSGRTLTDIFKDAEYKKLYSELKDMELTPSKPQSLLGWRRTHVQEIEGKPTLVLNEFQSDWAQTERAGRGTFESNAPTPSSSSMTKEKAKEILDSYAESFFNAKQNADSDKSLSLGEIQDKYWDDWVDYRTVSGPAELIEADKIRIAGSTKVFADFPMSEIKHHQFQIVGAIDDALKQGIDTIAIPIQRENELVGTAGVTKFYESLNQKVLPDIRKRLEKQGMRIKVSMEDYGSSELKPHKDGGSLGLTKDRPIRDNLEISHLSDAELHDALNKVVKDMRNELFSTRLSRESWEKMESRGVDIEGELFHKLLTGKYLTPYARNLPSFSTDFFSSSSGYNSRLQGFLKNHIPGTPANKLHILKVEEIPNKKVNWDVYGLIGALGLTSMLSGNAEAKETQNIVSPKPQQEMQVSKVPVTRQEAEQGTLQRILSQNKVAPLNEPKGVLQQYREMGLISQEEEDSYGFKKDNTILDDYRVDMKRQMPKTILEQEGNNLSAHRPTRKSGWTIGRGYDLTGRKLNDVISDFKEAGISEGQAKSFNHKPIKINAKQSKALGDIAWREKVDTARRIGLPIDKLNREGFLKVMSLVYRGDIVKGDSGYRGKLYDLAKKGDIKAIDRFVLNDSVKTLKSNVLYNRWKKFDKS